MGNIKKTAIFVVVLTEPLLKASRRRGKTQEQKQDWNTFTSMTYDIHFAQVLLWLEGILKWQVN